MAAVLALGAYLALYSVVAVLSWARWARPLRALPAPGGWLGPVLLATGFAGAWLLAELGRGMVLTGFPWALSGYAHIHGPFRVLAPWVGVYVTAAASAFVAAFACSCGGGAKGLQHDGPGWPC